MTIEIANRLVQLRKQKNLSQEELAARLGISRQAVSKWERAEASPDTDNLILLARLYGVSLDELLNTDVRDEDLRSSVSSDTQEAWEQPQEEAADPFFGEAPHAPNPPFEPQYEYAQAEAPPRRGMSKGTTIIVVACAAAAVVFFFFVLANFFAPLLCVGLLLVSGFLKKRFPKLNGAYPILCTMTFLLLGFCFGMWHPGWMIFLTIPLFYTLF